MTKTIDLQEVTTHEVQLQVSKILASAFFSHSERLKRFLDYVVNQTISGESDRLKGYTIGIEVFDRDESFDPAIDAIVRVEAGRLRTKLREYYMTDGINDSVIIELPKGKYSPVFRRFKADQQVSKPEQAEIIPLSREYPENSIAVLPFRYLSDDKRRDYFSDGITDSIICSLAKVPLLKVISLTSVMKYKNSDKTIKEIGHDLQVTHILEGTVLQDEDIIKITAQLIDARTDFHILSENYTRKTKGIIQLQNDIAFEICNHITSKLFPGDKSETAKTIDPSAYEAYLLGRRARSMFTKESFYNAADYFRKALNIEPDYAAACSGLASCYCGLASHGFELEKPVDVIPRGIDFAKKAIQLNDSFVDGHTYLGIMKLKFEWDWPGAESCFKKALMVSPNDARAHLQYSMYFESIGDFSNAIDHASQAMLVDPLSRETNMNQAWQYYQAGMLVEAIKCVDHLLEIEPDFWGAYWDRAYINLARGEYNKAIDDFTMADELPGGFFLPLQGIGYACGKAGRKDDALSVINKLHEIGVKNYVSPYYLATIYLSLGDIDKTIAYLEEAYKVRARSLVWIKVAREFKELHGDPRFQDLVERIGIPSG